MSPSPPSHGGPPTYSLAEGPPLSPPSERVPGAGLRWVLASCGGSGHLYTGISGEGVEATPEGQQSLQNESAGERAQSVWVNH